MLRTTRWVAAIIFLYSFPGYAEETFDTHFMIGGMRGEKVSEYRFDNKQPLPGNYELDVYGKKISRSQSHQPNHVCLRCC